jgi:DNA-binding XRE family transcriptional regulator
MVQCHVNQRADRKKIFVSAAIFSWLRREMLTTGNQLKAARALIGINQTKLAAAAQINPSTISDMERKGASTLTSGFETVRAVTIALEAAGIEFLDQGVRLRG